MIRRGYRALPGPTPVRVLLVILIVGVALVGLQFFYDWLGTWLLDQGGQIG